MIIISKKNIIINIIALTLIIFFSFHIFPKFGTYNKLDYKQIKVNVINTHLPYINLNFYSLSQKEELLLKEKDKFLLEYINFLKKNPNFIVDAPCPSELLTNDLRNIQIYNDASNDGLSNFEKFNVSFRFYNFTISDEKLDLNKCFNYIFIEAINRYYLIYREQKTKLLENELRFIQNLEKNNELKFKIKYYMSLLDEIKNGDDFFIDPNLSYAAPEQRNDKNSYKTIIFIICLMILVSINIGYRKLSRKQVSKFINKFVNTI